jgi:hypothetical protein
MPASWAVRSTRSHAALSLFALCVLVLLVLRSQRNVQAAVCCFVRYEVAYEVAMQSCAGLSGYDCSHPGALAGVYLSSLWLLPWRGLCVALFAVVRRPGGGKSHMHDTA